MYGLTLPWHAAKLIMRDKKLLFWSAFPIALTLVLYVYGISWLKDEIQAWYRTVLFEFGLSPESIWFGIIDFFTHITLLIVSALTFAFASTLVASPFNDILAEQTEPHCSPALPSVEKTDKTKFIRLVILDQIKAICAAIAGLIALLFSLLPILNIIATAVFLLLITFQYVSYPQTRRGVELKEGIRFLWRHLYASVGFGATITFLFAIPGVSSFVLPLAVVGGTLLVGRAPGNAQIRQLK